MKSTCAACGQMRACCHLVFKDMATLWYEAVYFNTLVHVCCLVGANYVDSTAFSPPTSLRGPHSA